MEEEEEEEEEELLSIPRIFNRLPSDDQFRVMWHSGAQSETDRETRGETKNSPGESHVEEMINGSSFHNSVQ